MNLGKISRWLVCNYTTASVFIDERASTFFYYDLFRITISTINRTKREEKPTNAWIYPMLYPYVASNERDGDVRVERSSLLNI